MKKFIGIILVICALISFDSSAAELKFFSKPDSIAIRVDENDREIIKCKWKFTISDEKFGILQFNKINKTDFMILKNTIPVPPPIPKMRNFEQKCDDYQNFYQRYKQDYDNKSILIESQIAYSNVYIDVLDVFQENESYYLVFETVRDFMHTKDEYRIYYQYSSTLALYYVYKP